jgi:hypothetical protein
MYTSESHFLPSQPPYLNKYMMFVTSEDIESMMGACVSNNAYITIFLFPMAEAAANSRGDGKSPKPVISDHCHRSECKAAS